MGASRMSVLKFKFKLVSAYYNDNNIGLLRFLSPKCSDGYFSIFRSEDDFKPYVFLEIKFQGASFNDDALQFTVFQLGRPDTFMTYCLFDKAQYDEVKSGILNYIALRDTKGAV